MKKFLGLSLLLPALALAQDVPGRWAKVHNPAAAAQATIGQAALTYARHIATGATVCITAVAAQPAIVFNLRDGATGAGTVLWTATLSAAAGTSNCVCMGSTQLVGTVNTAMTLESATATAATNLATVALSGYDVAR